MTLQIAHFSPHIDNGGLGQAIPKLCSALAARGNTVRLHVLKPAPQTAPPGVELLKHARDGFLKPLGLSAALKRATLEEASGRADILHTHSLWTMASMYPGRVPRRSGCRLIHSPQGTMAAWAMRHHAWRKRVVWALMQRAAVQRADCIMVTSAKECDEVKRLGFKQPFALIPNGIDIPALNPVAKTPGALRRLLFLGRLHPVKGLDRLLESWQKVQARFPDWELVIAGEDGGGYLSKLTLQARELKLERVSFPGTVLEHERDALYQSSDLFVLPSYTENFGLVVAEALANFVPAVVSRDAPWERLDAEGAGWWTDANPDDLAETLAGAMQLPAAERADRGARGRAWMEREYAWPRIAAMTERTYQWLLGGEAKPEWML